MPKNYKAQIVLIPFALIVLLLVAGLQECRGQESVDIGGKRYYAPTINNIIKAASMTTPEWRESMSVYKFSNSGYEMNCPYVSTGHIGKDDYMIIKCPTTVSFIWRSPSKYSLLGDAIDELEPYFIEMSGEMSIYRFRDGGYTYKFVVTRNTANGIVEIMAVSRRAI